MRPSCTYCARKHLGQASVLLDESRLGYPDHLWLAVGHLAEAESELLRDYPHLAEEVRSHRKRLEAEPAYLVPVLDLIRRIGGEQASVPVPVQPGTTPPQGVVVAPLLKTPECAPCEEAKRKARMKAVETENAMMGEDKHYCGRLIIMAPLNDFQPAYSLCSVILDQALAARLAGYRVHVWVNASCDLSKLPPLPPGLTVEGIIPQVTLKFDEVVEENVSKIVDALGAALAPMASPRVITHDLVFQAWYIDFAVALHRLADRGVGNKDGSRWWHLVHSSVGSRPPEAVAQWRATLPEGHRLLAVNYADVPFLRGYYRVRPGSSVIDTLLNPRDPRSFLRMPAEASLLITRHELLQRDVLQVYPVSGTRLLEKGLDRLITLFAALCKQGASAALVVANAHSNNEDALHSIKHLRNLAAQVGLPEGVLLFTSEELPDTVATGLDGDNIRSLFSISNLFAFPTLSEAGSLVLIEAALSQCLLVLNDSLPCMVDYVSRTNGMWVPWGSLKGVGQPFDVDQVAAQILERLDTDDRLAVRRAMFNRTSTEAYGRNLKAILEASPG